ncbi:uncharacterized protein N0V89_008018 [Didymosphaeria variabile]|uniref:Elongation factor 1 alpha-like protein n=1 Tax=Didymosphaeria variabile TaxID=1932322 RepID=A0A9W9C8G9_9PLEO|nr:uncharacterized protein N0V89_008018 [Didymosphaeria variabile]KAJ4349403.1 hypothetical protein N0V89_008018 [Didymosphaeria variabile]
MPPKSGFSRAKNVDYDDDDIYDDYSEEEYAAEGEGDAMSEEDKEQMAAGVAKVKEALGSEYKVKEVDIQDALWNYYYDVGKSVTHLKNKYAPKPQTPAKPKAVSRFDQAAGAADAKTPTSTGKHMLICSTESTARTTSDWAQDSERDSITTICETLRDQLGALPQELLNISRVIPNHTPSCASDYTSARTKDFFWDMPWGNVPSNRLATITMQPSPYKGGLLGGSSKLAALAAKRKQKQQEEAAAKADAAANGQTADKAVALLDRLNFKDKPSAPAREDTKPRYPRKRSATPPPQEPEFVREEPITEPQGIRIEFPNLRAKQPSMFGAILCGSPPDEPEQQHVKRALSSFPLPYANAKAFTDADPFSKPSPDDLVRQAQARSAGTPKAKAKTRGKSDGDQLADSVEKLVVETKVKSKNLDVVEEYRKRHVDHGKSTLMGRLLYDLKIVDERSVDKLRQEAETIGKSSFALAWLMDQTPEERSRGVTVDIATVPFETDKTSFTILDAPGHRDFIPNMIAGVSQADFAVLVVDAQENSFQSGLKGQTKEHALIVRSMGIQRLIVAVNKMDTVSWSKERFDKVRQATTSFFETASFSLKNITFIPCAGLTGDNVTKRADDARAEWYSGATFLEALEASEPKTRALEKPLRLTINDVFRGSGQNPLSISGQIETGTVQVGDVVLALPSRETATVKAIELPDGAPAEWAVAGQIPTLHLVDIDAVHLRLGDMLCAPTAPVRLVKSFTCKMLAFEHVMPQFVDVFRGRQQATGLITALASILNKNTGEVVKKKPRIVKPGEVARVRVELEGSAGLPLEVSSRIVLRDGGGRWGRDC